MGYPSYNTAGCEHFGASLRANPALVTAHWMAENPAVPGTLTATGPVIPVNLPVYIIAPPPAPAQPPVLIARIVPVRPPNPQLMFGDATWVKIFKTEVNREVTLDELVDTNALVPTDPTQVETAWKLLQHNPHSANSGVLQNQGGVNGSTHSVIRRIETFAYTGRYDPVDHGALCLDPLCASPQAGELGNMIVAQMTAANVGIPSVTVARTGNGTVTGAGGKINCGGSCTTTVADGAAVSLTATPGGTVFSGWGGACTGADPTCNLTVNDALNVSATFTPVFTLSIGRGGNGTVAGTPGGAFNTQINCGSSCSAKFTQGSTVTLTATPAPGLSFVNWTNGCATRMPICARQTGLDYASPRPPASFEPRWLLPR